MTLDGATGANLENDLGRGVERLGYIGVGAVDLSAWDEFATDVLGVQVAERGDDGTLLLRHDKHHYRIAVHPDPSDDLLYVGWQVADDAALEAMRRRLAHHDVAFQEDGELADQRRVSELITLNDPSGVRLEVFHSPLIDYQHPFVSRRAIKGFVTGDGGLGHMVITVDDFAASKRFYRDVLGFRVTDFIRAQRGPPDNPHTMEIVFLHCNERHHSLGFGSGSGRGKRLGHLMLEVTNVDDVGATYDLCVDRGVANTTIGRHPNDRMISFYMRSPSGWQIEYGYGARTVTDDEQVERFMVISEWGHLRDDGSHYGSPPKAPASA